jgi:formylglycine-generating enzyme required for sulfatase activity
MLGSALGRAFRHNPQPVWADQKEVTNTLSMKLVLISRGKFRMGSSDDDKEADSDEKPQHKVEISRPFFLAAHKTTQAQFEKVLGRNPSWFSATGSGKDKVEGLDTTRFPVEMVSFFDAIEFCNKLSEKEDRRPCYRLMGIERDSDGIKSAEVEVLSDGTGYRLPTEAEWEYCAQAGMTTRYSFGDAATSLGDYAWFTGNSGGRTHPVGEKKPNGWGLYDMGGLACEWCEDVWHSVYTGAPSDGSAWRSGGEQGPRVVRGGSWYHGARVCRPAYRGGCAPGSRNYYLGFRVVLVSP